MANHKMYNDLAQPRIMTENSRKHRSGPTRFESQTNQLFKTAWIAQVFSCKFMQVLQTADFIENARPMICFKHKTEH